jgi:hypothetical protein
MATSANHNAVLMPEIWPTERGVILMKRTLTVTSLALILTSALTAQKAVAEESVWIEYGFTCASWAEARGSSNPLQVQAYLVGLIDGLALGSMKDFWKTGAGLEDTQVFFWMDQHCANNPLDALVPATYTLMEERLGEGWNIY